MHERPGLLHRAARVALLVGATLLRGALKVGHRRLRPMRTALRIAWRELRASRARFVFVVLAVAVGVASLTGVRGFSRAFRRMLLSEARTLMAGDLTARVFALPP